MVNSKDCRMQVGVLGATSFVGSSLLRKLENTSLRVIAYSRGDTHPSASQAEWRKLESAMPGGQAGNADGDIPLWVCLAPLSVLPTYFDFLEAHGARRVVALSSTSRFTKLASSDPEEKILMQQLADAEQRVQQWAESRGVEWIILRPTLIYGAGQDRNIVEIMRFIRRFGFFPVFGKACGLRQPVHVQDVAGACLAALQAPAAANRAYNISGAETLTYRDMVARVFAVLQRKTVLVPIPLWMFRAAVFALRCLPRYRKWSSAMAERMNCDMVFDHGDAANYFEFKPRPFVLTSEDLPH